MRKLMLIVPLLAIAGTANALPMYQSTQMSCGEIRATVRSHGSVILKHPSRFLGIPVWETYVSGPHQCKPREIIRSSSVPSLDKKSCRVMMCDAEKHFKERENQPRERPERPDLTHGLI